MIVQGFAVLGGVDCIFAHLLTKTLKIMLKKINIQVGLFLMLSIGLSACGGGKSKGDKGKASTPAARKANMEKAFKGPAGIASRKKILKAAKKIAKAEPAYASMDEAQLEAAIAAEFDKQFTQMVEHLSSAEKITLTDLQNFMDAINVGFDLLKNDLSDDVRQALKTNINQLIYILAKAHGGLQQ